MNSFRGGMQVHAVPDDERALDAQGRPLPWGYAYADASLNRKQPVEKGPFGKPVSRRNQHSVRGATPVKREEDTNTIENQKYIDDLFSKFKKDHHDERQNNERRAAQQPSISHPWTSTDNAQAGPAASQHMTSPQAIPPGPSTKTFKEPTEVMIYGFGADYQYAAIDFYETASKGRIYEDYDRYPPNARYNSFLSTPRTSIPRSLSQDAIRRINTYKGGDHWIKVTFDSPEAAELACHYSPHIVHGFSVRAEPFRGIPPPSDIAIAATSNDNLSTAGTLTRRKPANAQPVRDWSSMPSRMHSAPLLAGGPAQQQDSELGTANNNADYSPTSSSRTASATASGSSATATGADTNPSPSQQQPPNRQRQPFTSSHETSDPASLLHRDTPTSPAPPATPEPQPLRIRSATRAILHPASTALLPVPHWTQRTFGHIPLLGSLVGGPVKSGPFARPGAPGFATKGAGSGTASSGGFIGAAVPRKDDGAFDWDRASWWWRFCYQLDSVVGTDICGIKAAAD